MRSDAELAMQGRVNRRLAELKANKGNFTPEQIAGARRELYLSVNTTNIIENWSVVIE